MTLNETASLRLKPAQRRVLGVLIEKAMTTPDQYPLSMNAVQAGCNQKSNRSPVLQMTEGDVASTLQELTKLVLVKQADVSHGARVNRFQHTASAKMGWSPRELAVIAELLLRGPQTVGELRTRADRMHHMPDLPYAQGILDELASHDPPYVRVLPREPGRSAVRYTHTFCLPDEDLPTVVETASSASSASPPPSDRADMLCRIESLERRVAALEQSASAASVRESGGIHDAGGE